MKAYDNTCGACRYSSDYKCMHYKSAEYWVDPRRGVSAPTLAQEVMRTEGNACGKDAKLFEPKETSPKTQFTAQSGSGGDYLP